MSRHGILHLSFVMLLTVFSAACWQIADAWQMAIPFWIGVGGAIIIVAWEAWDRAA